MTAVLPADCHVSDDNAGAHLERGSVVVIIVADAHGEVCVHFCNIAAAAGLEGRWVYYQNLRKLAVILMRVLDFLSYITLGALVVCPMSWGSRRSVALDFYEIPVLVDAVQVADNENRVTDNQNECG